MVLGEELARNGSFTLLWEEKVLLAPSLHPLPASHLTQDLDMSDFQLLFRGPGGSSQGSINSRFRLISQDRKHKITRLAETLSHQKGPWCSLGLE